MHFGLGDCNPDDEQADNEMQGLVAKPSLSKFPTLAALPSALPATPLSLPIARITAVLFDSTAISLSLVYSKLVMRYPPTNPKQPTVSSTVRSLARILAPGKSIPIRMTATAVKGQATALVSRKNRR